MSRIGKLPIQVPENVDIAYDGSKITVKGKFGTLHDTVPNVLAVEQNDGILIVGLKNNSRTSRALHGLYRTLINNMIIGVSEQFTIIMNLQGVGYRGAIQGKTLVLNLGYSHQVIIDIPDTISIEITQNTKLTFTGCDKAELGLFAANVRSWRPPEPYKGKGILYDGEIVKRKAGKSGK
jgi:large subunit ribosomal protein L6